MSSGRMAGGTPPEVEDLVRAYLRFVDEEAPGLVEGLYLIGSVALDDFQPSASDVDFLAVSSETPDDTAVAALVRAHARLRKHRKRPFFDGGYVTWSQL